MLIGAALTAAAGALWARPALPADWSETLEAALNGTYATNPQLLPGSSFADESALLAVDGSISVQTERRQLSVTPRLAITRFQRAHELDIDTGSIDFTSLEKFERAQWTLSGQALTDSTVSSELGLTGITNVNRRHGAAFVSSAYQYFSSERLSWQLQGAWQITRYSDAARFGLTNYDYRSLQFGPTWSFGERLQGLLSLATDHISPHGGSAEDDYSVNLQLRRSLSEHYAWRAALGMTRVQASLAGTTRSSVYELGGSRQGERVQWDFSVKRSVIPIGLGLLARADQAALAITAGPSEHSTLNLALSTMRTAPVSVTVQLNPIVSLHYRLYSGANWEQLSAEWKYLFARNWALSLSYLQARAHSGKWQDWANGRQARLGILWQSGRL